MEDGSNRKLHTKEIDEPKTKLANTRTTHLIKKDLYHKH